MKRAFHDEFVPNVVAVVVTAIILLLMGRQLLKGPHLLPREEGERMRISFIERVREPSVIPPRALPPIQPDRAGDQASAPARTPEAIPPALPPRRPQTTPTAPSVATKLYTREGRAKLPPGMSSDPMGPAPSTSPPGTPNERELARAKQVLERPNPIDYRKTRFDKDWVSDGTAGDIAAQKLGKRMESIGKLIFGEDTQPAAPRPPPDVRFNPGLHERSGDLGSEKTGDAYKSAPIAFEKAPDLKGEASRRIRQAVSELEKRHAGCDPTRTKTLLAPVQSHLADLQRVEYAMARGADPVQAEHLLPRTADNAYDQARRALWYADRQLAPCKK
ncbi:hypothetical protein [Pseudoxanthomonas sp. UTMC 1351]|uniref:hypothetical protein n=1 Tax=Pseudoxanthomonas sp. UTMC 1351 TaxID=2695853 RepID=UPI0034CD1A77